MDLIQSGNDCLNFQNSGKESNMGIENPKL